MIWSISVHAVRDNVEMSANELWDVKGNGRAVRLLGKETIQSDGYVSEDEKC